MPKKSDIDASFLEIDQHALDEEWVNQPELFYRYAAEKAQADREVDEAKAELDITRAELDEKIREDPSEYGINKLSNPAVERALSRCKSYQQAVEALADAKYKAAILDAAVKALDQRKYALQSLVSLHGQNYFSTPRATDDDAKEFARDSERKATRKKHKRREE
jgi:hypothetical protein